MSTSPSTTPASRLRLSRKARHLSWIRRLRGGTFCASRRIGRWAVIGGEKLTRVGNMKLTHPTKWFLHTGGTDGEVGGSDGVDGVAQAWREYPGAGASDGTLAEHRATLFARRRGGGGTQTGDEAS